MSDASAAAQATRAEGAQPAESASIRDASALELARRALGEAQTLAGEVGGRSLALLCYRSALVILARTLRAQRGSTPSGEVAASTEADAGVTSFVAFFPRDLFDDSWLTKARPFLASILDAPAPEAEVLGLAPAREQRAIELMDTACVVLLSALERGSAPHGRQRRRVALARAGVVALGAWLLLSLSLRDNLALRKTVSVTSTDESAKVPAYRVVDGNRTNLGFHSKNLVDQALTIDLGGIERVSRIDVYNRKDCCQARAVPLRLELSTDGNAFSLIDRRLEPFNVWRAEFAPVPARFVRLTREGKEFFHLAEVEVY
jgi:hypothetical protein